MCDNFEELSETYFRFSLALLRAEFGFLTKLNDSTTMKGKCYAMILIFLCIFFNTDFIAEEMFQTLYQKIWTLRLIAI